MKKASLIFMIGLAAILLSAEIYSQGWSGEATVSGIYSVSGNTVLVKLSSFSNPDGCLVNADGDLYFDPQANPERLSIFLSAYHAGSTVNVYAYGCTPVWSGTSYANVAHLRLL